MKILLTGKNGQLGHELIATLEPLGQVYAVGRDECDLRDLARLRDVIREYRPDVIVNPAAYTAVDRAESEADIAEIVNAKAPALMAEEANRLGALLIHYSTDYVFDGNKIGSYAELDPPNPQNVYGLTKLAGETAVLRYAPQSLVLRTSWVFGAHGQNFLKTMLGLAEERDEIRIVADQFGAPTSVSLLANVTTDMIRRANDGLEKEFPFGLYHLTAGGETTWFDYASFAIELARRAERPIKADASRIFPISTSEYPTPAKRPKNSVLETEKFKTAFGISLPSWSEGVEQFLMKQFEMAHAD